MMTIDYITTYLVSFQLTDCSDTSVHEEFVRARNPEDALEIISEKYDRKVRWTTIRKPGWVLVAANNKENKVL